MGAHKGRPCDGVGPPTAEMWPLDLVEQTVSLLPGRMGRGL